MSIAQPRRLVDSPGIVLADRAALRLQNER